MDLSDLEMILSAAERIFQDAELDTIDRAGGMDAAGDALWSALEENGFTRICVSEEHGGIGADLSDGLALIGLAGRFALPLPLADTVLAGYLLSQAGIEPPEGKIALAVSDGPRARVAFGEQCAHIVHADGEMLHLSANPSAEALPYSEDGAGVVDLAALTPLRSEKGYGAEVCQALGAVARAAAMAGALQSVLDMTLEYTTGREQFGRPLAKFQAIQHHLSDMACETAAAAAAVELARDAIAADPEIGAAALNEIAVAKIRCGLASSKVAASAHQAHGAMGFTYEYALGRFTRRLWQWQDDFGTDAEWSISLGRTVLANAQDGLWPDLSA